MKTTILFFPTFRCNLACRVCHFKVQEGGSPMAGYQFTAYGRTHRIEQEWPWPEFLKFFHKFQPYHLEITGGEPLVYEGLHNLVAHIPEGSTWAITSNTLLPVDDLPLGKCLSWSASYHGILKPVFSSHILALRRRSVPLSVSLVVEREMMDPVLKDAHEFAKAGFRVNLLRELNPGVSWEGTPEWDHLVSLREKGYNVVEEDIPPTYRFDAGYLCMAGGDYFTVYPDGKVYTCYSRAMLGGCAGDIFDFIPERKPRECWEPCLGCAADHKFRLRKLKREVPSDEGKPVNV